MKNIIIILTLFLSYTLTFAQTPSEFDSVSLFSNVKQLLVSDILDYYKIDSKIELIKIIDSIYSKTEIQVLGNTSNGLEFKNILFMEIKTNITESIYRNNEKIDTTRSFSFIVGALLSISYTDNSYSLNQLFRLKGFYENDYITFSKALYAQSHTKYSYQKYLQNLEREIKVKDLDIKCLNECTHKRVQNKYYECLSCNQSLIAPLIISVTLKRSRDIKRYNKLNSGYVHLMGKISLDKPIEKNILPY